MMSHTTPSGPDDLADQRAENAQYYLRVLHKLIDIGVTMVEQVQRDAVPQNGAAVLGCDDEGAPLGPAPDHALAYDRLARSIRRSIMLARAIQEPVAVRDAGARVVARKRTIRAVEDSIARVDAGEARGDSLRAELSERMDSPELDDDIDNRPVEEIIEEIRHDLGLTGPRDSHHWKRRTPKDVAELSARAAAPSGTTRAVPAREPSDRPGWGLEAGAKAALRGGPRIAVRDG